MKISKLFHWLYFSVMMLPIFIIPIFAIFTRNDNYSSSIELHVEENKVVDFNQIFDTSNTIYGNTIVYNSYTYVLDNSTSTSVYYNNSVPSIIGNKYYFRIKSDVESFRTTSFGFVPYLSASSVYNGYSLIGVADRVDNPVTLVNNDVSTGFSHVSINVIDLTQMFGSGNEPTLEQFESWYSQFYDYQLSDIQLLKNYGTLTYNDSDVGSQYLYTMYNGVDKYFNYDKVFNFGLLYDWLQLTFFDGNATLGFFIFWHLLIYWLLTSLLWLLFDVLMYVPLLVHRWLDKASLS